MGGLKGLGSFLFRPVTPAAESPALFLMASVESGASSSITPSKETTYLFGRHETQGHSKSTGIETRTRPQFGSIEL